MCRHSPETDNDQNVDNSHAMLASLLICAIMDSRSWPDRTPSLENISVKDPAAYRTRTEHTVHRQLRNLLQQESRRVFRLTKTTSRNVVRFDRKTRHDSDPSTVRGYSAARKQQQVGGETSYVPDKQLLLLPRQKALCFPLARATSTTHHTVRPQDQERNGSSAQGGMLCRWTAARASYCRYPWTHLKLKDPVVYQKTTPAVWPADSFTRQSSLASECSLGTPSRPSPARNSGSHKTGQTQENAFLHAPRCLDALGVEWTGTGSAVLYAALRTTWPTQKEGDQMSCRNSHGFRAARFAL